MKWYVVVSAPAALVPKLVAKLVVLAVDSYIWRAAEPASVVPTTKMDLGAAPNGLLKVIVVSQVDEVPPVPVVMVNEPALSVEPAAMAALGVVPQLVGVLIVGAVV